MSDNQIHLTLTQTDVKDLCTCVDTTVRQMGVKAAPLYNLYMKLTLALDAKDQETGDEGKEE